MITFELVSITQEDSFGKKAMDWRVLGNGRFSMFSGNNRLTQQCLKTIMINKQPWGYGTSIATALGVKDSDMANGLIGAMIEDGLIALRKMQEEESQLHGQIPNDELIKSVVKLKVDNSVDPTSMKIDMSVLDSNNVEIQFQTER